MLTHLPQQRRLHRLTALPLLLLLLLLPPLPVHLSLAGLVGARWLLMAAACAAVWLQVRGEAQLPASRARGRAAAAGLPLARCLRCAA